MNPPDDPDPAASISPMTSLESHERRINKLEERLTEMEICHSESIYTGRRADARHDIETGFMLERMGLGRATDEMIDEYLDRE